MTADDILQMYIPFVKFYRKGVWRKCGGSAHDIRHLEKIYHRFERSHPNGKKN